MKITILCSNEDHPVNDHLQVWTERNGVAHDISLVRKISDLLGGDILFLISCSDIVRKNYRTLYRKTLVIHASALPLGRGWSPHIWQIVQGSTKLTLTLLETEDKVDSGAIWEQLAVDVPKTALWDEINELIFNGELELMDFAVRNIDIIQPREQDKFVLPTYFAKRIPADSRLDVNASLASQFNLLRVCDPIRYPAYFELGGKKFKIRLERLDD